MRRRVGRPGPLGTMARTAVVAGTASATVNAVNNHSAKKQAAAQQQAAGPAAQQVAQPEPQQQVAAPATGSSGARR